MRVSVGETWWRCSSNELETDENGLELQRQSAFYEGNTIEINTLRKIKVDSRHQ